MRKTNSSVALIITLSVLFLSGCQRGQTKTVAPKVLAEFEYSDKTGFVTLPLEFQNQVYQFDLDTGSTHTIFSNRFSEQLGKPFLWPIPYTISARLADGEIVKGKAFPTPKAKVGPLKLKGSPFVPVVDYTTTGGDSPGIIGMDFLKKYIVRIDFDNRKVTFFKGKKDFDLFSMFKPKENKHPEWGEPVPLKTKLFQKNQYFVEGSIVGDIETDFLIDSGWKRFDTMNRKALQEVSTNGQKRKERNNLSYLIFTLDNNTKLLEGFSVGSLEYKNNIFQNNYESALGLDFLSRHIVTFDFPNKIMYLKKGKYFDKQPIIPILIAQTGCTINSDNYVVTNVDPNSLAYSKGIREEDTLIKINGRDISNVDVLESVKFWTIQFIPGNTEMSFTFKRGNEIVTISIRKSELNEK